MPRKIEISYRTIVFTVFFLVFAWFLYYIRDILFQVFVALLIMTILNPTVTKLHRLKVPRVLSVMIVYVLLIGFLSLSIGVLVPPLVEQTKSFSENLPSYLSELSVPDYITEQFQRELTGQIGKLPSQALRIGISIFSNVVSVITVFIFALYFLLAREKIDNHLGQFLRESDITRIGHFIDRLEQKLGGWARGEIILMFIVGLMTYIGLIFLGIPYALPLALFAGLMEFVPNIGPIVSAVPSVVVGLSISPFTGLAAAALGFLIQQVENYLLVPKVMEKSAGVSPILTLLSLIIGFKVAGIVGAILSVPIVITVQVFLQEFVLSKK